MLNFLATRFLALTQKIAFVYGEPALSIIEEIKSNTLSKSFNYISYDTFMHQKMNYEKVLIAGDIDEIKALFFRAISNGFEVAIIPLASQVSLQDSFLLSSNLNENLKIAINNRAKEMDILYANEHIVLHTALVGDAPPLNYRIAKYRNKSFQERLILLYNAYLKVKMMKHTKVKLITGKFQEIETVATGVVVIEHDNNTCASKLIKESVSTNDAQLDALIISPNSILDYLQLMGKVIFNRGKQGRLPNSIGYIKSERLRLESRVELPLMVDGKDVGVTPVEFMVKPKALKISLPDAFWKDLPQEVNDKESVKIDKITYGKEKMNYLQKKLPFFTHAGEDQYKSLLETLRDEAKADSTFMILMFISTILVTMGLYLNSASVVIGAMLLAPLMHPIIALSMGMLRQDETLSLSSLKSIGVGVLITIVTSALIAWVLPFEHMTQEMAGRIKPSILDMIVAIVSGVGAAYVKNNAKVAGRLAGVAIAVALVPPIATVGIGLGWGRFNNVLSSIFTLFDQLSRHCLFSISTVSHTGVLSDETSTKRTLLYTILLCSYHLSSL